MKKHLLAALSVAAISTTTSAQNVNSLLRLFPYNQLYYNPGYAGMQERPTLGLSAQQTIIDNRQSIYHGGNKENVFVSFDMPIEKISSGIGAVAYRNGSNYFNEQGVGLIYSYHLKLNNDFRIGLGSQVALKTTNRYHHHQHYSAFDSGVIYNPQYNHTFIDSDFGIWVDRKGSWFGLSVQHALNPMNHPFPPADYPFQIDPDYFAKHRAINLTAGTTIEVVPSALAIAPSLLLRGSSMYTSGSLNYFDLLLNNTFIIKDLIHAGGSLNLDSYSVSMLDVDSYTLHAGISVQKRVQLIASTTRMRYNTSIKPITEARMQIQF